jgi:hypothetical protein
MSKNSVDIRLERIEAAIKKISDKIVMDVIQLNTEKCIEKERAEDAEWERDRWEEWYKKFPYMIPYTTSISCYSETARPEEDFDGKILEWLKEVPFD